MTKKNATIMTPVGVSDDVLLSDNNFDGLPTLLSVCDVANFLSISVTGVRRLQDSRAIAFFKVGGSVRYSK